MSKHVIDLKKLAVTVRAYADSECNGDLSYAVRKLIIKALKDV